MKKVAVIVAGGMGVRMGTKIPKQFLLLKDKPLLWYSIAAFTNTYPDIDIIIVLPAQFMEEGKKIAASFSFHPAIKCIEGGDTRFESVKKGLVYVQPDCIVFIHDAVRCLISHQLIEQCYHQAMELGTAIPAVTATDSIRIVNGNNSIVADRNTIRIIQTPQTFKRASVLEAWGKQIHLIEGDYLNIKITRSVDLLVAGTILQERNDIKG